MSKEIVPLQRECDATEIPSGRKITFVQGTELIILQTLGGAHTVMTHMGQMATIAGKDSDALGKTYQAPAEVSAAESKTLDEKVWAQLKTCYDPEIPHNIVDLGLVYECKIAPLEPEPEFHKVDIIMTLTAPGCGMGEWLRQDVKTKVSTVPGVRECNVEVVFDPPWTRERMHPALRREL